MRGCSNIILFLTFLTMLVPLTWRVAPEYTGFTICTACASTNLYASIRLKQLQDSADERHLSACYGCPDLQIGLYAIGVKAVFGMGTMGGFMVSKNSVAASGIACSSPIMMTYLWAEGQAKISGILVIASWITAACVILNAILKEPWESTPSWDEFVAQDLAVKIIFVILWTAIAVRLSDNVAFLGTPNFMGDGHLSVDIAVFGCVVAYMFFSLSSSLTYTYGMLSRFSSFLASSTWPILILLLLTGKGFVKNILIVEGNPAALLIFSFAPSWFPISHCIYNLVFLSQWRQFDSFADVCHFFGPLILLFGASYMNVYLFQLEWTVGELPPAFYQPTEFWRWATERIEDGNDTTTRRQLARVEQNRVSVELGAMEISDRALSPRSSDIMNRVNEAQKPKSFNFSLA